MNYAEQSDLLAGPIGLLSEWLVESWLESGGGRRRVLLTRSLDPTEMQCTRVAGDVSTDCVQIFGGTLSTFFRLLLHEG